MTDIKMLDYDTCETQIKNILMMGSSRSGKTTFIKYVKKLNHVTNPELYRGTVNPESEAITIRLNGEFITLNFMDNPGFDEVGKDSSRSNEVILESILSHVKGDVTKIHLILIAVNASTGLNSKVLDCIRFFVMMFGRDFKNNMCLLMTGYESYGDDQEKKFMNEFSTNPALKLLYKSCGAGVLFTGALSETQRSDDKLVSRQKARIGKFMDKIISISPGSLKSDKLIDTTSSFTSQESTLDMYKRVEELMKNIRLERSKVAELRVSLAKNLPLIKDNELKLKCESVLKASISIDSNLNTTTSVDYVHNKHAFHKKEADEAKELLVKVNQESDVLFKLRSDLNDMMIESEFE